MKHPNLIQYPPIKANNEASKPYTHRKGKVQKPPTYEYTKQRQKDDTNINAFKHGQIDKLPHCRCPAPCLNLRCARALVDGYFRPSICWACSVNNKPLRVKGNLVNVNLNSFAVDGLCTLCAWQKKYDIEKDAAIKETYNEVLRAISGLTTVDMTVPDTNSPEETMEPTVNTGMFKN